MIGRRRPSGPGDVLPPTSPAPRIPLPISDATDSSDGCYESALSDLEHAITPTDRFFVRSHFPVPRIDSANWVLSIEGEVEHPSAIRYAELTAMPQKEITSVLECAGNSRRFARPRTEGVPWGNGAVGNARWKGVPLADLLRSAQVRTGATEVLLEGADRGNEPGVPGEVNFQMSIPIRTALHPDTLLAVEMNGQPLTPSHGFPVRVLVPDWYGMASVKWLTRLEVLDRPFEGYFRKRAYAFIYEGEGLETPKPPVTFLLVKSLITSPSAGRHHIPEPLLVGGVAWSGSGAIQRVEVSVGPPGPTDDPLWLDAKLYPGGSAHDWTHWELAFPVDRPGFYLIRSRAIDVQGHVQPNEPRWNYRGVGMNPVDTVPIEICPPASL
ncbi:MAG: sulfite oxidase [Thermoplasmata archaeon]